MPVIHQIINAVKSIVLVAETAWDRVTFQGTLKGFTLEIIFVFSRVTVAVNSGGKLIQLAQASHRVSQVIGDEGSVD